MIVNLHNFTTLYKVKVPVYNFVNKYVPISDSVLYGKVNGHWAPLVYSLTTQEPTSKCIPNFKQELGLNPQPLAPKSSIDKHLRKVASVVAQ